MAQIEEKNEEGNLVAGYFNLVALRKDVKEKLIEKMETVKELKKQLKDIDEQMEKKGTDIVNTVKDKGEVTAKITLDDFFQ
jgi:hypothetical protein